MVWCVIAALLSQDPQLKQPQTKAEVKAKLHTPDVVGMSAVVRMNGYERRLKMESDSPFQNVPWRCVGPEIQGGRVIDIDSPKDRPKQLFVAFATGGLWKTDDEGQTWTSLFDQESSFSIGDIAVGKSGDLIWLGSGENNSQRTSYSGTGVFKSLDGGKSWRNMGLPESHHIGRIVIDPRNENTVWVAALGHLYSQNEERGVYKSVDGGRSWKHVLKVDKYTGAVDLVLDPRNPDVAFASLWDRDRRAWNFREGGQGTALYKTADGGKTWTKIRAVPCDSDTGRIGLALAPSRPDTVYAFLDNQNADPDTDKIDERQPSGRLTLMRYRRMGLDLFLKIDETKLKAFLNQYLPNESKSDDVLKQLRDKKLDKDGLNSLFLKRNPHVFDMRIRDAEVWRTDDSGRSWRNVSGRMGAHGGYYGGNITVDPKNPDLVYTSGLLLLRSKDGGKSWESSTTNVHVDFHVTFIDRNNTDKVWIGCDGGLYMSENAGKTWRHINNLSVGQFTTIAVDDKTPYNIIGGMQDNGTMRGPSTYVPGRSDPNLWVDVDGGDGSAIAVDPRNGGDLIYTASQWGSHSAQNLVTKERWSARAPGQDLRYNWISPILISPHHPDIIYLGSQKLHRSFNQGRKYEDLSGDLTKNRPTGNVPHSSLTTISESPLKFGLIYVGTDDGNVWVTPDGGVEWKAINTPQKEKWVTRIVAGKWDKDTVYCTQNGYREDDFTAMVWRSTNMGQSWESIVGDLPEEPVNTIREDPIRKDLLWVGTDMGVYASLDGGRHWIPYGGGLPHTPVHDLVIQPKAKELVIASHARSVWVVSTEPALELTDDIKAQEFKCWAITDVTVSDRWGMPGAEWNKSDPDPPKLSVKFWTKSRGAGTMKIVDSTGKVIVTSSAKVAPGYNWVSLSLQLEPGKPFEAGDFAEPKTPEEALQDPHRVRRPKFISPGEYEFVVEVAGKIWKEKFKVKPS